MFDAPMDTWYVWIGVAVASLAVAGVAVELPAEPKPDAAGVADTVDRVAASPYPARASHPVSADAVRFGDDRIELRNGDGIARERFSHGPVVPVGGGRLEKVLDGAPARYYYDSVGDFRTALDDARNASGEWRPVDGRIVVRKVTWRNEDVTLVGT